jgi:hypothetical protein
MIENNANQSSSAFSINILQQQQSQQQQQQSVPVPSYCGGNINILNSAVRFQAPVQSMNPTPQSISQPAPPSVIRTFIRSAVDPSSSSSNLLTITQQQQQQQQPKPTVLTLKSPHQLFMPTNPIFINQKASPKPIISLTPNPGSIRLFNPLQQQQQQPPQTTISLPVISRNPAQIQQIQSTTINAAAPPPTTKLIIKTANNLVPSTSAFVAAASSLNKPIIQITMPTSVGKINHHILTATAEQQQSTNPTETHPSTNTNINR